MSLHVARQEWPERMRRMASGGLAPRVRGIRVCSRESGVASALAAGRRGCRRHGPSDGLLLLLADGNPHPGGRAPPTWGSGAAGRHPRQGPTRRSAAPSGRPSGAPFLGIPVTALEAYAYAARVAEVENPKCHLAWTTLAGIGMVESHHGTYRGATVLPNGDVRPPIRGVRLDGSMGNMADPGHRRRQARRRPA